MALSMKLNFLPWQLSFFLISLYKCKKGIKLCIMFYQNFTGRIPRHGSDLAREKAGKPDQAVKRFLITHFNSIKEYQNAVESPVLFPLPQETAAGTVIQQSGRKDTYRHAGFLSPADMVKKFFHRNRPMLVCDHQRQGKNVEN